MNIFPKKDSKKKEKKKNPNTFRFYEEVFKKKEKIGILNIKYCRNNTLFTLTDIKGNTQASMSGGQLGYRNARKSTWTALMESAQAIAAKAKEKGIKKLYINLRGFSRRKSGSIRKVFRSGCSLEKIIYRVPIPYNGCRSFRKRRK
jgi:small subunit ribosomal protein S11